MLGFGVVSLFIGITFKAPLLAWFRTASRSELTQLRIENASLRQQLGKLNDSSPETIVRNLHYRPAQVYSSFPFNNQKILYITQGAEQGIVIGMTVTLEPEILLGQITEVWQKYSAVRTVFDPNFKVAVRIGASQEEGLFEGGNTPIISLIKDKKISTGEAIVSAGVQFPYGLSLGTLGSFLETSNDYFKKAEARLGYNLGDVNEVYVITNYLPKI
ncbi:MAG TPA: rod shape-determining protein MreC [Candidatus Paceibacterota bacterium]